MESKNTLIIVLLVVLIGVLAGVGLLIGIENAVTVAIAPLQEKLSVIEREQKNIEASITAKNTNASNPMADIERELGAIQGKLANLSAPAPAAAPGPQGVQQPPEDMNKVYNIPVGVSSVIGPKNAPVTITEFSDFQCPFCARFWPGIKDVLAAYPDKVRVVIKNFPLPFHPNARPAAKLAMAANEQGKFQGMMESLLANGGDASDAKIKEYAQSLGLNLEKLLADYKNQDARWEKQIQDDMQLASESDVRGTPTFYLNGKKTSARDLNAYKDQIDPLLKK